MPTRFSGTVEQRLQRLEQASRRCDANNRWCTRAAVEIYQLWPADGFGNKKPDARLTLKRVCSYHRRHFTESGSWIVEGMKRIKNKESGIPTHLPPGWKGPTSPRSEG